MRANRAAVPGLVLMGLALLAAAPGARARTEEEILEGITRQKFFATERQRIVDMPKEAERRYLALAFEIEAHGLVSKAGVARWEARQQARRRAEAARHFREWDIDGDGALGPEEMALPAQMLGGTAAAREGAAMVAADRDGDGRLTIGEMLGGMQSGSPGSASAVLDAFSTRRPMMAVLLAMDLDGDGVTRPEEIIRAVAMVAEAGRAD